MLPFRNIIGERRERDSHLIGAMEERKGEEGRTHLPRRTDTPTMELLGSPSDQDHNRAQHLLDRYGVLAPRRIGWARQLSLILREHLQRRMRPNGAGPHA
jgi:hypothetical protein